jgi:hypothetical protein
MDEFAKTRNFVEVLLLVSHSFHLDSFNLLFLPVYLVFFVLDDFLECPDGLLRRHGHFLGFLLEESPGVRLDILLRHASLLVELSSIEQA